MRCTSVARAFHQMKALPCRRGSQVVDLQPAWLRDQVIHIDRPAVQLGQNLRSAGPDVKAIGLRYEFFLIQAGKGSVKSAVELTSEGRIHFNGSFIHKVELAKELTF